MCVCVCGRAMACASSLCVCVCFFFSVNAKKGKNTFKEYMCVCVCVFVQGRIMCVGCVPISARCSFLPLFPPSANLGGGSGSGDIWEQFLSAPAKVVKGLISSHAGALKKTASSKN